MNTVSFWLGTTIFLSYQLSGSPLPGPPPRARETLGISPFLLFKKNFAFPGVEGGYLAEAHHLPTPLPMGPIT